jgi:LPPG:FO 2-phospho-L-lactate transferase
MSRLGRETWFRLGDQDLATHLHRTLLLRAARPSTAATRVITEALGVRARLVPMADEPVRTELRTDKGWLSLEEFFVRERCAPDVRESPTGVPRRPGGALMSSRRSGSAEAVVVCCSNPVTSIRTDPPPSRGSSTPLRARRRPSSP